MPAGPTPTPTLARWSLAKVRHRVACFYAGHVVAAMRIFLSGFSAALRRSLPVLCISRSALFLISESFSLTCMLTK